MPTDGRPVPAARRSGARPRPGSPRSGSATTSGDIIGNAIERTAGALPLTDRDVLVVTQKIVSKAEGAVVDLTGVVPGAEATEFAERYGKDPRQVQVVLERGAAGRPDGERRADHRDPARVRLRERRRRCVERRPRFRVARDAPAARSRCVGRGGSGRPSGRGSASMCPSSCPTRSAGPGAGGSSTSRSACPGCCRSTTCAACPTPTAGSCAAPSEPSPTSWPPPPSSRSARPPDGRSPSSAAPPFTRGEGRIQDLVMPSENDLFR